MGHSTLVEIILRNGARVEMLPERPPVTSPPRAVRQVSKVESTASAVRMTVSVPYSLCLWSLGVGYAQLTQWRLLSVGRVCGALVEVMGHDLCAAEDNGGMTENAEVHNVTC